MTERCHRLKFDFTEILPDGREGSQIRLGCTFSGEAEQLTEKGWRLVGDGAEGTGSGLTEAVLDWLRVRLALPTRAREIAEAVRPLVQEVEHLMTESKGVYGLHLNGDPAPWSEIDDGGRFEGWLTEFNKARAMLDREGGG